MLNERRNTAAEKLLYILPKYLYNLEKDSSVHLDDTKEIKRLKAVLRSDDKLPTDLLQFRHLFTKYA
jgi:ssRNA-specific RNase YbeY (16S rRNA maturation enzyme)